MDSFPEAFERFEDDVDIGQFESYHQLTLAFRYWAGEMWRGTRLQWEALNAEAENVGFETPDFVREELADMRGSGSYAPRRSWRRELVKIRGKSKNVYRDLRQGGSLRSPSSISLLSFSLPYPFFYLDSFIAESLRSFAEL